MSLIKTKTKSDGAGRDIRRTFGIATIAGSPYDPSGDGGPATLASINLGGVAFRAGNLYLTDGTRIRKIAPDGTITTVVGLLDPVVHQPIPGFSGDGGPALGARIRGAFSLAFDSAGNLYIADLNNSCVRKITARVIGGIAQPLDGTETITTVAGTGTLAGNSGDNNPATSAKLNAPRGICIDPMDGTLYIADQINNNVRKVDPGGIITTIATGVTEPVATPFNFSTGVAVDPITKDVYVADVLNSRVCRIAPSGTVTKFAGTGMSSASGNLNEGGAAIAANVHPIKVIFVNGTLYLVDSGVGMVRKIDIGSGIITTVAGIGLAGYSGAFPPSGDGGPALAAFFGNGPGGVQDAALDDANNLFITDASSHRVRFAANAAAPATIFGQTVGAGNIATVAGPQGIATFSGDGGPATGARLFPGGGITFDEGGNLYIADAGNNRVRRIDTAGIITTIAGNGTAGFAGVPGPADAAELQPGGLTFGAGNIYATNNGTRVLEIAGDFITLIANKSGVSAPPADDGTPAIQAQMGAASIVFDTLGNLYAADSLNNRIWKVDTNGNVKTIAGGKTVVLDGVTVVSGIATQLRLFGPGSLAFDPEGNLYTVDGSQDRILKITAHATNQPLDGSEIVTIFAGTGQPGFAGDGKLATAALLNTPGGLVFDADGALYFSDGINFRIRKIDTNGIITTIAGTGVASFLGDGGPALAARIRGGPLAFDSSGNLYLTDIVNSVVRVLDSIPPAVTFGTPDPAPNTNGWNNTSVTVPFTAADTGAGVASTRPTSPLVLTAEGLAVSGVVSAKDRAGNRARLTSPAVKIDKAAPVISGMPEPGLSLWPANGEMVQVGIVTAGDALSGVAPDSFEVTGTSSEPHGARDISIEANGSGGYVIKLRAECSEHGHGRTYTITANASDFAGNTGTVTATCVVPRHQG